MRTVEKLMVRDALMRCVRTFFQSEGFFEVETPIRVKTPCMELHINAESAGNRWLRTSPELYHKRLLAQGAERIFEIGKCFRQGEYGNHHHPEYTMLEWYRIGGDYNTMLADTKMLFSKVWKHFAKIVQSLKPQSDVNGPHPFHVCEDWKIFTIAEIYEKFANWNPINHFDADRFYLDMVEKVEPALSFDVPVVLKDYPASCCALARLKPDDLRVAERWELYLGGTEVANAYSELTDPVEQRARFEFWGAQRQAQGKPVYPIDEGFIQCLETMPPAGGCALGIDRLLMVLCDERCLNAILPY